MPELDKLDYLYGQVNALLAFAAASIQYHPEPEKLREGFRRSAALSETNAMNLAVSEDYLRGQREMSEGLEKVFQIVCELKKNEKR
jgi:hypothetical protein